MNVFMIGGTGLLGSAAAAELIARGHQVKSIALPPLPEGAPIPEEMEIVLGNYLTMSDDELREKMQIVEDPRFTREYLEADKRSIANAIQVFFTDGSSTQQVVVEYPIGHRRRRAQGIVLLEEKFRHNLATRFTGQRCAQIVELCNDQARLESTPVNEFVDKWVL